MVGLGYHKYLFLGSLDSVFRSQTHYVFSYIESCTDDMLERPFKIIINTKGIILITHACVLRVHALALA